MKCIRNLLMYKDLQYIKDGVEKIASWSHIIRIYDIDKSKGIYSQFNKLTDEHVVSSKIKKMEVKNCSQVFSHSLASAMYSAAKVSTQLVEELELYLNPKATETTDLLLFFDILFDTVNGSLRYPLECARSKSSTPINSR
jgi:hypothetical protein